MIDIGWIVAGFVWVMGMWLAWRVNQAIIEVEYRELMNYDKAFFIMVCIYSTLSILLWPFVQLVSMQKAFSHDDEKDEEE